MTCVINLLLHLFCLLVAIEYCNDGSTTVVGSLLSTIRSSWMRNRRMRSSWLRSSRMTKPPDEKQLVEEQPDEKPPVEQQRPKVEFYLDPAGPGDEAEKPPNDEPGDAVPPGIDASVHK
ncbi:hypothetical protein FOZ60_013983 [Perkinsus olseni]|uniref:Secreted protein n=1 Tax=Perkinsus olseni TaxID=32597 RepID=A0A7J6N8P6_PEROL|nr:hypothetical protein FOZ60_013983 [Perkinsus olseni]